jgi:HK97 family phage portal protein
MQEKRGLFQKIFGKAQNNTGAHNTYKLLNTWQTTFTPFSGNAYDVNTVRAAVDSFARRAATVKPRHIRRGEGKITDVNDKYNRILQFKPNPYTTAYKFYYRLATQYKLYNNAFVYPVWNEYTGKLEALYNINANSIELIEYQGELYCRMTFATGNRYTCPYTDLIHIGSHFNENDIFGENNRPVFPVLETANTFNQSMSKFAELIAVVRGILKIQASTKNEDLKSRRDEFIRDNLKMENNGAGVIVTDNKYDYTPITDKQTPIPTGQLTYVKSEIYDYFGTNENIVQNKETPEQASAYYSGEIKPFYEQCTQAFTNGIFSGKEPSYGNEIIFEGNSLQNEKLSDKTATLKFLADIGAITIDGVLLAYNMAPLGGEEGSRRVQTLNMVNAAKADEYQLGEKPKEPTPAEGETNTEGTAQTAAPQNSEKETEEN